MENVQWKILVENIWGKYVGGNFGGNAILDILEPPDFQKLSINWILEALCICICLQTGVSLWGKNILEENATLQGHTGRGGASVC